MTIKTDGIVIREQTTGEQDRLVTLLTREIGVIRGFVNGGRNPKNKNVSATGLLCYSQFTIDKTAKGVYIIREASPKEVFFSLRNDIVRLSLAQYFAELAFELSPREENADEFLNLVLNGVYLVAQGKKSMSLVKAATELRLVSVAGYMPSVVACDMCGKYESEEMKLSIATGKLYCDECLPGEPVIHVPSGVVYAIRHICFSEPQRVFSFNLSKGCENLLCDFCERYLKTITMKRFKTLEFYKAMTQ